MIFTRKQMIKLSLGVLLTVTFASCKKGKTDWMLPPNDFHILLRDIDGNRYPDSILAQLKLYYIENGVKVYRNPQTLDTLDAAHLQLPSRYNINDTTLDASGVLTAAYVNMFGVNDEYWYFLFPNGDIDTLQVQSIKISKKEGRANACYCENPFTLIKYNGKDAPVHSSIRAADGKNVYILQK